MGDKDRAAILARRQRFVTVALAGLAVGCDSVETDPVMPCLSPPPDTDTLPMPCLEPPPPDTEILPCLEPMPPDEPPEVPADPLESTKPTDTEAPSDPGSKPADSTSEPTSTPDTRVKPTSAPRPCLRVRRPMNLPEPVKKPE